MVDASECPPTFGVDDRLVRAVIAGGHEAMFHAIEGAEDSAERGAAELEADGVGAGDVVVGLSASGGAPYVLGALRRARELGAIPMGITCNPESRMHPCAMSSWHPTSDRKSSPAPRVSRQGQRRS